MPKRKHGDKAGYLPNVSRETAMDLVNGHKAGKRAAYGPGVAPRKADGLIVNLDALGNEMGRITSAPVRPLLVMAKQGHRLVYPERLKADKLRATLAKEATAVDQGLASFRKA